MSDTSENSSENSDNHTHTHNHNANITITGSTFHGNTNIGIKNVIANPSKNEELLPTFLSCIGNTNILSISGILSILTFIYDIICYIKDSYCITHITDQKCLAIFSLSTSCIWVIAIIFTLFSIAPLKKHIGKIIFCTGLIGCYTIFNRGYLIYMVSKNENKKIIPAAISHIVAVLIVWIKCGIILTK